MSEKLNEEMKTLLANNSHEDIKDAVNATVTRDSKVALPEPKNETDKLLVTYGWTYDRIITKIHVVEIYGNLSGAQQDSDGWTIVNSHSLKVKIFEENLTFFISSTQESGNAFEYYAKDNSITLGDAIGKFCKELAEDGVTSQNAEDRAVLEMNTKYAMITMESQASVIMENKDGIIRKPFGQVKIVERDKTMLGDKELFDIDIWHNSKQRRNYAGLDFDPTHTVPPKLGQYWNLWFKFSDPTKFGFRQFINATFYDSLDLETAIEGCKLYVELIREVICGGSGDPDENKRLFRYVMYWLASAVTEPARKPMTALVLTSGQGCGKGTFVESLLQLYGEFGTKVETSHDLTNNFNHRFKNNLLTFVDEALYAGDKRHKNLMKNLISSKTRSLEGKGVDTITIPNYSRYIYASNEEHVVALDDDDRRHVVIALNEARKQDGDYFIDVETEWANNGMECFLYLMINKYAMEEDFKTFHFEKEIVKTAAKVNQTLQSNPLREWWEHRFDNGCFTHKDEQGEFHKIKIFDDNMNRYVGFETDCIYHDYVKWAKDIGGGYRMAKNRFSANFKKLNVGFESLPRQTGSGGDTVAVWNIDTRRPKK